MGLCCRTAALRIFVNSLTQINIPVVASTNRSSQYRSFDARSASRSFQTSSATNDDPRPESYRVANITYHQTPQDDYPTSPTTLPDNLEFVEFNDDGTVKLPKKPRWTPEQKEAARKAREARALKRANRTNGAPRISKQETSKADASKVEPAKPNKYEHKRPIEPKTKEEWRIQKEALKEKFPEGWNPRKRLSPDALSGIRALHAQFPEEYTTEKLSEKFEMSPEAIRRILRSKWEPTAEEEEDRQMRWFNRGKSVWSHWAELGKKPPVRWRKEGIVRDPKWNRPRSEQVQQAHPIPKMPDNFMG
ncbi:hypothetical protein QBC38DRAFT_475432 [Podospora fimiseda]|uniref:Required for respiratory growth protein 9, mitochondrial n=1 Tax=Podospora fimiseda TaxID=252190 RepID=A0AAN7H091_9PEZI|nr:hypothetical protein QBC38DRAFT_475432 [Podospora fimiseda]